MCVQKNLAIDAIEYAYYRNMRTRMRALLFSLSEDWLGMERKGRGNKVTKRKFDNECTTESICSSILLAVDTWN